MLVEHRKENNDFTKLILRQWKETFDILETIIVVSLEVVKFFAINKIEDIQIIEKNY